MTSVFDVLAHEDNDGFRNTRRATVAARARVEDAYGAWIRQDPVARLAHVEDEINVIAVQTAEEHGVPFEAAAKIAQAIWVNYRPAMPTKVASIEVEAGRMPRMCPFHKDVTDISLNSGDPSAGFSAMAQHWGGPRHCEGEGYEGDSCKFKPQMTTQTYWDERAEKMEQRKQERAEREEQEAIQQAEQAEAEAEFNEPLEQETEVTDNVIELHPEPVADSTEVSDTSATPDAEIPMSMAAKTADKDTTGLGGPVPKMDKSKWSPKGPPQGVDDPKGPHPTVHQDIVEPVKATNKGKLDQIGEQVTEHQDVTDGIEELPNKDNNWPGQSGGPKSAISAVDVDRNPIIDMMNGDYDGFTPEVEVQRALVAHKRRV